MEEKKEIKVKLSTVLYLFIIFTLIIIVGVVYYFGFVADKKETVGDEKVTNNVENVVSNTTEKNQIEDNNVKENEITTNKVKQEDSDEEPETNKAEKIEEFTQKQVLELFEETEEYKYLDDVRLTSLKKNGNKYKITAEYYVPVILTKSEYNKLVSDKKIIFDDKEYVFDNKDEVLDAEGFGYIVDKDTKKIYWIEKIDKGYVFVSETGGFVTTIDKLVKKLSFSVSKNTKVIETPSGGAFTLEDFVKDYAKDRIDYLIDTNSLTVSVLEDNEICIIRSEL